jgi:outer membrane murein-binding lipoprotein Lpp
MIPLAALSVAGRLLSKFSGPLMIVALVAFGGLLIKGGFDKIKLKREVSSLTKQLDAASKELKDKQDEFDKLIRDYNEQARAADAREAALEKLRLSERTRLEDEHAQRHASTRSALDLALNSLRNSKDADRRAALRPEGSAPADCRNYAASPGDLSVSDAELALRIGAAAEGVAGVLAYCDGYLKRVVPRSSVEVK